jgi:SAM-dependent methyltransferase
MDCLSCGTELKHKILDLGFSPLANGYLRQGGLLLPETYYPLQLFFCNECSLVQLSSRTNPQEIFNESYYYISSSSQTWKEHCKTYAENILRFFPEGKLIRIVEVGTNDGVLLQQFKRTGIEILGIDPAKTATAIAAENGIDVITDFFTNKLALSLADSGKRADLIIGNNVLAHVPDLNDFVKGIATLLKNDGICTLEFPYLLKLLEENEFDTVYHEHYSYFSVTSFAHIAARHGLQIFDCEKINIHGGSLRVYLQKQNKGNRPVKQIVQHLLSNEALAGVNKKSYYDDMAPKALQTKKHFINWLSATLLSGKKVMAYGAAAKGNTFLNYCNVTADLIPFVADVTKQKQGLFLPGSHIPIVNEDVITNYKPDFIIVLPWNFKSEIDRRLQYVKEWGCQLVYFIPGFEIV